MLVTLVQKIAPDGENALPPYGISLFWRFTTDSQGRFAARMVPGDFGIGIGDTYAQFNYASSDNRGKAIWTRDVRLESGKPVDVEFRIPTPFVGRVLQADGRPAPNANVSVYGLSQHNSFVITNDRGEFRLYQAPEPFSYLTFRTEGPMDKAQRMVRWIESDEIQPGKPMEFRLSDIDAVGRFVDAQTGEPIQTLSSIAVSAEVPESKPNAQRYLRATYYHYVSQHEKDGTFRVAGLTPGVKYTIRYNRPSNGDNADEDAVIVIPAAEGNLIDLGDLKFDPKP